MCGRFALATEKHILDLLYELEARSDLELQPRYNIAPTQETLALRLSPNDNKRELVSLKWGLVPFWADDKSIGSRMINARSETVAEKPSFRDAFRKRRLLVPASGFYEWKKEDGGKQPYFITQKDKHPFSFAGLWERWDKGDSPLETFTILTTEPNSLLAELHNRMPVIIPEKDYARWLDPSAGVETLQQLLIPYPAEELSAYPVSRLVNSPANDSSELINPQSK
ncbi:MAG: SOS response-associated peptidase [Bacillota bacterium]|nr:SOS response-associated peptidase [Bacillota bacterium]